MALSKKCDRCGTLYERYNRDYTSNNKDVNGFSLLCISTTGNNYLNNSYYDLCEPCKKSLLNWINEAKINNSNDIKIIESDGDIDE